MARKSSGGRPRGAGADPEAGDADGEPGKRRAGRRLYRGLADGTVLVAVPGATPVPLASRADLRNHSPTGFSWGYAGSGPAQLALALACDVLGDDAEAVRLYQDLKTVFVARLPQGRPWGPVSSDELRLEISEAEAVRSLAAWTSGPG